MKTSTNLGKKKTEVNVKIGTIEVGKSPLILKTVLGSCVAVILYDQVTKIGGMIHIFLPYKKNRNEPESRFADTGVPKLLNDVIALGAKKANLNAYIVGGGNLFKKFKKTTTPTIAEQNVSAAKEALLKERIMVIDCSVGKDHGYKVSFDLETADLDIIDLIAQ